MVKRFFVLFFFLQLLLQSPVSLAAGRLSDMYAGLKDKGVFSVGGDWLPYPEYEDRKAWEKLLGPHAAYLIRNGEKYLDFKWQSIDAVAYLAYERTGERAVMENPLKQNRLALNALILAELAEGKGRFMDQLINGTWHISHMPSWVLSAHLPRQRSKRVLPDPSEQIIDLGSGALGAQMSVAWHFFRRKFDQVDPLISEVICQSVKKQILDSYLNPAEYAPNWWLGFELESGQVVNNWNPWCNADVILCFLLLEQDQNRLDMALEQSVRSVDIFLEYIKADGACEEGPAYWGHAAGKLYDYLQIMYDASRGRFSLFDDPQLRNMGEYISRSFVKDGWVVNFADASARLSFTPALIYNYGKAVSSMEMQDFAIYNLADKNRGDFSLPTPQLWTDIYRALESLKYIVEMTERVRSLNSMIASGCTLDSCQSVLRSSVPAVTWYPLTEFCYFKNASGWFFAAKGGHNNESHNHNDIGTFILYDNGVPVFIDAGVGTYTKKTFSAERYSIWSMQSDWHNLPVINGISQRQGAGYRSSDVHVKDGKSRKSFSLDISSAYPEESECKSWIREYVMTEKCLTISDTYDISRRLSSDVLNFMVQGEVYLPESVTDNGYSTGSSEVVIANCGKYIRLVFPSCMTVTVDTVGLDDPRLSGVWGKSLRRLSFRSSVSAPLKGKYTFRVTDLL